MATNMKVRVKTNQLIELPEGAEIVSGPTGKLIKIEGQYFIPEVEFMVSYVFNEKSMTFHEPDESSIERILSGLKEETIEIEQD